MDAETQKIIEETVIQLLRSSNLDEVTEFMIRNAASEKLGISLSEPTRKKFVRQVVEAYLADEQAKAEKEEAQAEDQAEEEKEEDEEEHKSKTAHGSGAKEYDDAGDLIICRLSDKRRVTITDFKGKTLVSIREFYRKDGKELPTSKGISLTAEQWASFKRNVPAVEKAIKKMESRLN